MLVDTSVWIDFFNGHESKQVEHLACAIAESESIVVPGVVLTEILLGLKYDAEAERISSLLNAFDAVDELILYNDMQYTRRDWRNRNQIKTPQGVQWLTVPVRVKGKYDKLSAKRR